MASLRRNVVISVLFTLFGGPGILLALVPWRLTHFRIPTGEPTWQEIVCAALIVAGLAPLLESIWRFIAVGRGTLVPAAPTEHLVVTGLYRHVRNPMYIGVLTVIAAESLLFESRGIAIELAWVWLGFQLFVRCYEEPRLTRTFPEEFERYRQNVRRWLPRLTPWTA